MLNPFRQSLCVLGNVAHMCGLTAKRFRFTPQCLNPATHLVAIHFAHGDRWNQFAARPAIFGKNAHTR